MEEEHEQHEESGNVSSPEPPECMNIADSIANVCLEEDDVVMRRITSSNNSQKTSGAAGKKDKVTPLPPFKLGIVSEVFEDSDSADNTSYSSDDDDDEDKLKEGQARIEWYPNGKLTAINQNKIFVMDRSLMMGEVVCRVGGDARRVGTVIGVNTWADLLILPAGNHVIQAVQPKRLNFVNPYDATSNSGDVILGDWLGSLLDVEEKLLMRTPKGYKFWLLASEAKENNIRDLQCKKRNEESSFEIAQWYEGQQLSCPLEAVRCGKWVAQHQPPLRTRKKFERGGNEKIICTIEKVVLEELRVDWLSTLPWSSNKTKPPSLVRGDGLTKIRPLDIFEHQTAQIGDRLHGHMEPTDLITDFDEWKDNMDAILRSMEKGVNCIENPPDVAAMLKERTRSETNDEKSVPSDRGDGEDAVMGDDEADNAADESNDDEEELEGDGYSTAHSSTPKQSMSASSTPSPPTAPTSGGGVISSSAHRRPEYRRPPVRSSATTTTTNTTSARHNVHRPSSAGSRHRGHNRAAKAMASKKAKIEKSSLPDPASSQNKDNSESRFIGEILFQRSYLDVLWQDGTIERNIQSVKLKYSEEDLDEHIFHAGCFVRKMKDKDDSEEVDPSLFGFVHSVDTDERLADVTWYRVDDNGACTLIQREAVSEMDLEPHNGLHFPPSTIVKTCCLSNARGETKARSSSKTSVEYPCCPFSGKTPHSSSKMPKTIAYDEFTKRNENFTEVSEEEMLANVGQCIGYDLDTGKIVVRWLNGVEEKCFPTTIARAFGDGYDDDDDTMGNSTDNDDIWSDGGNSSSWTDVESDDDNSDDSDGDTGGDDDDDEEDGGGGEQAAKQKATANKPLLITWTEATSFLDVAKQLTLWMERQLSLAFRLRKESRRHQPTESPLRATIIDATNPAFKFRKFLVDSIKPVGQSIMKLHRVFRGAGHLDESENYITVRELRFLLKEWISMVRSEKENMKKLESEVSTSPSTKNSSAKKADGDGEEVSSETKLSSGGESISAAAADEKDSKPSANKKKPMEFIKETLRLLEIQESELPIEIRNFGSEKRDGKFDEELKEFVRDAASVVSGRKADCIREYELMSILEPNSVIGYFERANNCVADKDQTIVDLMIFVVYQNLSTMIEMLTAGALISKEQTTGADQRLQCPVIDWGSSSESCTLPNNDIVTAPADADEQMEVLESGEDNPVAAKDNSNENDQIMDETPVDEQSASDEGKGAENSWGGFEMLDNVPANHTFFGDNFDAQTAGRHFLKALHAELKLLRGSLPPGLHVRAYSDRMDLFSCLIVGPSDTPYEDSLFLFHVRLPISYPVEPPYVQYKAYSSEQLNPNLYQTGKVCVSLLGTWTGKGSERWNPGSNLLQVFVSIQGLILNAEPYFNEAGYESRRGMGSEFVEKSRRYNEIALMRSVENLNRMVTDPPADFEALIKEHVKRKGMKLYSRVNDWIGMKDEKKDDQNCLPRFPLFPLSGGFKLSCKKHLQRLKELCEK